MFGFFRVAAAVPELRVADTGFNASQIIALLKDAEAAEAAAVVFPELAVTGYTCGDLFQQKRLLDGAATAIASITAATAKMKIVAALGAPFPLGHSLYNCAFVIHAGKVLGIVPKSFIPNYREFYEKRWFSPAADDSTPSCVAFMNKEVPFGTDLLFDCGAPLKIGVEICEDLWGVVPPSSLHCLAGATLTLNLSASDELVGKADYRRDLVKQQSARCISGYVYASGGIHESTGDLVYGGHALIAENGALLAEGERFLRHGTVSFADIDCERLLSLRRSESSFGDAPFAHPFREIGVSNPRRSIKSLRRAFPAHPFVPSEPEMRRSRCAEIFSIQSAGLAKRIEHAESLALLLGISGGLDSTLALLVAVSSMELLKRKTSGIIAVTMPGFGTTERTYKNAVALCNALKVNLREIDIKDACLQHFKDIGHDPKIHDVTYENVQARERTQILMNLANKERGLVVGTGDLSEIALGWSTYNGDHMSMYAVNCGVPKTLVRYLIQWVADKSGGALKKLLEDVIATPVTPELLPKSKDGGISQRTEDIIGPYELHDFFLYHIVRYGAPPEKVGFLAKQAFGSKYSARQIKDTLKIFVSRFFSQQFKRSCIPDGPKVGTIALSPRGDWRMPSDASSSLWTKGQ